MNQIQSKTTNISLLPTIRVSTAIIFSLVYIIVMGAGMAYMYHGEGVRYGVPRMLLSSIWWVLLILAIAMMAISFKYFGITMGLGRIRERTAFDSKNLIFLFVIAILIIVIESVASVIFPVQKIPEEIKDNFYFFIFVTFLIGFAEEVQFRGLVLRACLSKYGTVKSILISGAMFSLLHVVNYLGGVPLSNLLIQLLLTFVFGMALAYLTLQVNTIIPAIIFHWLWNLLVFFNMGQAMPSGILWFYPIIFIVTIIGMIRIKNISNKKLYKKCGFILGGLTTLALSLLLAMMIFSPYQKIMAILIHNSKTITEFRVEDNLLYMNEVINSKTYNQLVEILEENPQIDTLVEENVIGSIDDDIMIKVAYLVRERGLNTHLLKHSDINSGGVDLFLAGVKRSMERGAHIGVHSWAAEDGSFSEARDIPKDDPRHENNRKYIEDMIGDDKFYWYTIYAASAGNMYAMTEEEIVEYGLVTEPIIINESSTRMSGMLNKRLKMIGNQDAQEVYIYSQGGPAMELNVREAEVVLSETGGLSLEDTLIVTVHQYQTLHPWKLKSEDIDFQQAIKYDEESVKAVGEAIRHFKSLGKKVYVVGTSFGAFVVQDVLASYGNTADGYVILVGRLDIEEGFWREFAAGRLVIFQDGVILPAPSDNEAAQMGGGGLESRNLARLAGGLGHRRYSELLMDIPLMNVVYGFGALDQIVGPLSEAEKEFLLAKDVVILTDEKGHVDTIFSLMEESINTLKAKLKKTSD